VHPITTAGRAFRLATLSFLPLFIWWLGWFPGFLSPDSLDQLQQVETGTFTNGHPAFHTITLWLITRFWNNPGAVTLVQILVLALVLGLVARRLAELGLPAWLAAGAAWVVALLPAVGPTSISLWKDVAFTLAFLWVFSELLLAVRLRDAYWWDVWNPVRLGTGLSLLWLYRHNGLLTVIGVVAVLAWANRKNLSRLMPAVITLAVVVVVVQGPVYWLFSVERSKPAAAEVLIPVVAASFVHEPGNFTAEEVELLASIAPLEIWQSRYDCDSADPLLFDPSMDIEVIRRDPAPLLRLGLRTLVRDLDTSAGLLWCRASYLFVPAQPADAYLQRPPFAIPDNDLGAVRDPLWSSGYRATRSIFRAAESTGWLWLTWRPAVVIWSAAAVYLALTLRRRTRPLLIPGSLLAIHLVNVAATSLNHEFRLAFPLYVAGLLSLPLLWFARHPDRLAQADGPVVTGRGALLHDDIAPVGARQHQAERVE
jgi:hypothetical protein